MKWQNSGFFDSLAILLEYLGNQKLSLCELFAEKMVAIW